MIVALNGKLKMTLKWKWLLSHMEFRNPYWITIRFSKLDWLSSNTGWLFSLANFGLFRCWNSLWTSLYIWLIACSYRFLHNVLGRSCAFQQMSNGLGRNWLFGKLDWLFEKLDWLFEKLDWLFEKLDSLLLGFFWLISRSRRCNLFSYLLLVGIKCWWW